MVPAGDDFDLLFRTGAPRTVDYAVVPGNPPRPPAGKIATEGLGFADSFERAPSNILQEGCLFYEELSDRFAANRDNLPTRSHSTEASFFWFMFNQVPSFGLCDGP